MLQNRNELFRHLCPFNTMPAQIDKTDKINFLDEIFQDCSVLDIFGHWRTSFAMDKIDH